jgi:hypothetical protein
MVTFDLRPALALPAVRGIRALRICIQTFVGIVVTVLVYWAIWGGATPNSSLLKELLGYGLTGFILILFLIASFRYGPQADQLKVDGTGVTFERGGTVRRTVRWNDWKLDLEMSRLNAYSGPGSVPSDKPTHRIFGLFPAATYVTPSAFEEIVRSARSTGLSVRERPSPQDPRWTWVIITPPGQGP